MCLALVNEQGITLEFHGCWADCTLFSSSSVIKFLKELNKWTVQFLSVFVVKQSILRSRSQYPISFSDQISQWIEQADRTVCVQSDDNEHGQKVCFHLMSKAYCLCSAFVNEQGKKMHLMTRAYSLLSPLVNEQGITFDFHCYWADCKLFCSSKNMYLLIERRYILLHYHMIYTGMKKIS